MYDIFDIRCRLVDISIKLAAVPVSSFHEALTIHKANLAISQVLSYLDKFELERISSSSSSSSSQNG